MTGQRRQKGWNSDPSQGTSTGEESGEWVHNKAGDGLAEEIGYKEGGGRRKRRSKRRTPWGWARGGVNKEVLHEDRHEAEQVKERQNTGNLEHVFG